jgi:hypothetical protein
MQLSAANLLLASQQPARAAASTAPDAQAKFSTALAREGKVETAAFEPIEFKPAAPTRVAAATPVALPTATGYGEATRLGANIDIRV